MISPLSKFILAAEAQQMRKSGKQLESADRPQPVRAERGPGAALSPRVLRAWCHALPRMRAFSLPASPLPVCSRTGRAPRPRRALPGVIGALGRGRERGNAVKGNVE